jgi:2-oxoacid:acceptor oxidoreductase gamma subunit (pyruvate/2-ketoisovalerate family)
MIEMRIHGRGGQGTVIGGVLLARALLEEGKYVTYFPEFGGERRGAPVRAFLRIDERQIYLKQQIYEPDIVVVMDDNSTAGMEKVISGLKSGGKLIINSPSLPEEFQNLGPFKVTTIAATRIAMRHRIGSISAPIANTTMVGAIAKVLGLSFESVATAIRDTFKADEKNTASALEAYEKLETQE